MLTALHIRNFVIVDELELDFHEGFTALTGETGAGKSILIDALQQLFGARSDVETIREGTEKSDLSATFSLSADVKKWLQEHDYLEEGDDALIIRRTLDRSGRTKAWINGLSVTLQQLKELSSLLVLVHGQHAHQSLTSKGAQLKILDAFGTLEPLTKEVSHAWTEWRQAQRKLEKAKEEQEGMSTEKERLVWFLEGIQDLSPEENEWESINEEYDALSRHTDILEACQSSRAVLTEDEPSALELIDNAISSLEDIADVDKDFEEAVSKLNDAREIVDDVSSLIEHKQSNLDFDEERFNELDSRLSAFMSLARKHRIDAAKLYSAGEKARAKLDALEQNSNIPELEKDEEEKKAAFHAIAQKLSEKRKKAAEKMSAEITAYMQKLAMAGGSLKVDITPLKTPSANGLDDCEFLVAGHAGVSLRPLAKIASGGELARISLAIAVTDCSSAMVDTLIFDEVDTGIGGGVAEVVGRLLQKLGNRQQVLCVTHLPQVASCANEQFQISKVQDNLLTSPHSEVKRLSHEERVREIARMLGGLKLTETTIRHAEEMLSNTGKPL